MSQILVIDETPFWRSLAADALRLKGHHVTTADSILAGLAQLGETPPDLVVLDVNMTGLPGWDFLIQTRSTPQFKNLPVIILTAEMQREELLRARQLGVIDYLLKPQFSLMELLERVDRRLEKWTEPAPRLEAIKPVAKTALPAASPRPLLTREQCMERAERVMGARTLSGVVSRVIASASSPRTDMSDLAALVGRDPMLSARVVAAANRLENASDRRVINNLMDAVRVIGSSTIRDIASSLWVYDTMPLAEPDGYNPIRCWQHSIAVARLCDMLASLDHRPIAYLLGLCHDLGEILFRTHFGTEYRQVLELAQQTSTPRAEIEKRMLGLTHGELVQSILRHLGLPDAILQPIAAFHAATDHGAVPSAPAARLLMIADSFSTGLSLNISDQTGVRPLSRVECRLATGIENPPPINCELFRAEVVALTAECARLGPREQADLIAPTRLRRPVKVWLARDPSFSAFDPVAAAIDPLAELTVHTRLPAAGEWIEQQAIIVLTRNPQTHGLTPQDVQDSLTRAPGVDQSVLYLCGKNKPTDPHPIIQYADWPIAITKLSDFIAGLEIPK
jgi:HD-like signal output (HDOD) protein/CheY-like chemotaxis protein